MMKKVWDFELTGMMGHVSRALSNAYAAERWAVDNLNGSHPAASAAINVRIEIEMLQKDMLRAFVADADVEQVAATAGAPVAVKAPVLQAAE